MGFWNIELVLYWTLNILRQTFAGKIWKKQEDRINVQWNKFQCFSLFNEGLLAFGSLLNIEPKSWTLNIFKQTFAGEPEGRESGPEEMLRKSSARKRLLFFPVINIQ